MKRIDSGKGWKQLRVTLAQSSTQNNTLGSHTLAVQTKSIEQKNENTGICATQSDESKQSVSVKVKRSISKRISEETALKIMQSRGQGFQNDRAFKYGASLCVVEAIDEGKSWKHLRPKILQSNTVKPTSTIAQAIESGTETKPSVIECSLPTKRTRTPTAKDELQPASKIPKSRSILCV